MRVAGGTLGVFLLAIVSAPVFAQRPEDVPVVGKLSRGRPVAYTLIDSIVNPCSGEDGSNAITFIRRGKRLGDLTYMWGVNICTKETFQYSEPTQSRVIRKIYANPLRIVWAKPGEPLDLGADGRVIDVSLGAGFFMTTAQVDAGAQSFSEGQGNIVFSGSVRYKKFAVIGAHSFFPTRGSWMLGLSVYPFRTSPTKSNVTLDISGEEVARRTSLLLVDTLSQICGAGGERGFTFLDLATKPGEEIIEAHVVSFCTTPHLVYRARFKSNAHYFSELNSSFAKFADWRGLPSGDSGFLGDIGISIGYGKLDIKVSDWENKIPMLYTGIDLTTYLTAGWMKGRWRLSIGKFTQLTKPVYTNSEGRPVYTENTVIQTSVWVLAVGKTF